MTNSPSDADQPVGFFPDQDTNRSCDAYPTDDIAPDPTLAGSRRPTSIDAHANPSLVSSPAFKSPASPDFHDIQDRQKQPLYVPVPTSPPPTRQESINGNLFPRLSSMSARNPQPIDPPPPIVPLPKPPAIGPRHLCPPSPRKRSTPSGTWRPPSRIPTPNHLHPLACAHTRTPPSAITPRANHPSSPPSVQTASPPGLGRGRPRNARNATLAACPRGAGIGPPRCSLDAPPPHVEEPGGARPVGVSLRVQSDVKHMVG